MREPKRLSIAKLCRDEQQPRKHFDEAELLALGHNMKQIGQQVPVIVYGDTLLDGERRWRAAQLVGITELDCVVLSERPSEAELRIVQMSIEAHKVGLSAMERSNFLHRIRTERGWQVNELAERLNMRQPLVSKLLAYQKLCPEAQQQLHAGMLDMEKAFIVSQEAEFDKQRALLKQASNLTRDQLRRTTHSNGQGVEFRSKLARFPLVSGATVIVQGREMNLGGAIDALQEAVKELKQGQRQGLDIATAASVMRDKAKSKAENDVDR